jgi:hypothetical protein
MNGQHDPSELGPLGEGLDGIARELDAFADETRLAPPVDLADRIMAAVAAEPVPTPPVTFLHAVGALALVDAWRAWRLNLQVALGQGRAPRRLRLQALAVVVIAALLVGIGGSTVAVGAARLVQGLVAPSVTDLDATPDPSGLEVSPQPSPTMSSDSLISPDESVKPSESTEPGEIKAPGESSEPAENEGRSAGGGSAATPRPDRTPRATETPEPDETEDADETNDDDETATPKPNETPHPTSTSDDSGDGSGSGGSGSGSDGSDS